jgi:hypothetical protein
MLSAALVILAFFRPAPAVQVLDTAVLEQRVSQRVAAAVQKAVAETETRQAQKTAELLAAAERRFSAQRQEDLQSVAQALEVLQKRANVRETMLAWNRQGEMK